MTFKAYLDNIQAKTGNSPADWKRLAAHGTWISLVLMIAYLAFAVPRAGGFNPSVYAGYMNRLVVLAYIIWQLVLARRLDRSVP